jgi:hypothetical protein
MKRNILPRRPWLTAGLVVASLVLVTALTLTAFNLRPVHAAGTGSDGPFGGCTPVNGAPTCHIRGASAYAQYVTTDGCIYSSAGMWIFENLESDQPGGFTGGPAMYAWVYKYDMCNFIDLEDGYGYTTAVDFTHDGGLESASVNTTMLLPTPSWDNTPPVNVTINLKWKGVGSTTSYLDNYQFRNGSTMYRTHYKGDNRAAVVSGTFSDGTTNYAATPTMSTLYNMQGGTLDIIQQQ